MVPFGLNSKGLPISCSKSPRQAQLWRLQALLKQQGLKMRARAAGELQPLCRLRRKGKEKVPGRARASFLPAFFKGCKPTLSGEMVKPRKCPCKPPHGEL